MLNRGTLRVVIALVSAAALSGCVSYHDRYYGDAGVYYGGGYETSYHRPVAPPLNPVVYPYWSLDYFYFSRYHHPYSVFVGYREPLYYPYPGWVFGGYYAPHRYGYRPGFRASLGFGYPWYGFGHVAPRFSLGFFAGSGYYHHDDRAYGYRPYRHTHRLRDIDRRLRDLQQPASAPSRAALVSRDRRTGRPLDGHNRARSNTGQPARSSLLRDGARGQSSARSFPSRRAESRGVSRLQPRNAVSPRNDAERSINRSRLIRNRGDRSAVRESGAQSNRVQSGVSSAENRRQQLQGRGRATLSGYRSDRRSAPSSTRGESRPVSTPPPRSTRARARTAPPVRARSAPRREAAPQQRSRPSRAIRPRNEPAPRSRVRSERRGASRAARGPERNRSDRSRRSDRGQRRKRPDRLD
jgi:hypothetical protein